MISELITFILDSIFIQLLIVCLTILGGVIQIKKLVTKYICSKYKNRKKFIEKIDLLKISVREYWDNEEPNYILKYHLLNDFTVLSKLISKLKFSISPRAYRHVLYILFTMDMEDKDIYLSRKRVILATYIALLEELEKYKKFIK